MINKNEIRDLYLKIRNSISDNEKMRFNKEILIFFVNSFFYKNFETFLVYISIDSEVGTTDIIRYLLNNNKKVAVPFCSGKNMSFYYIESLEDLIEGKFGIPSVDISVSKKVENFDNALCIVPAVSFDNNGNRLGYGGGYYDRFLSENKLTTLGLCFDRCISEHIPTEKFDIKIDYVLSETHLRNHK